MVNTLTLGQATVGKVFGDIGAGPGSFDSTNIEAGAIQSTHILAGEIVTTHILAGEVRSTHILAGEIDTVVIAAAAIETALLDSLAVGTTNVADNAVASTRMSMNWATLGNGAGATTTAPLPAANGGYLLTNTGATGGFVITGAAGVGSTTILDEPTAGDHYRFVVDVTPSTTVDIDIKSLVAVFNAAGDKVIRFDAAGQYAEIEALSSARWIVVDYSPGVRFSATT